MIWLALIPVAAVVLYCWWPRRPAPSSPFPPVTDTVAGYAQRTLGERLSEPYDWTTDGDDAA